MAQRPPDSWPPHFRTGTGRAGSLEMAQGRWRDREGLSNALPQQHRDQSSCPHPARPRRVPGAGSGAPQASPPTFPWAAQGVPDDWQARMGVCPWPLLREAQSHWRPLRAPCRPPGLAQRGLELAQGHRATRGAPHRSSVPTLLPYLHGPLPCQEVLQVALAHVAPQLLSSHQPCQEAGTTSPRPAK